MKLLEFFRGMRQVAQQEFLFNLKSIRFVIMGLISALLIVGGAYGFSGFFGGSGPGGGLPPIVVWPHPAYAANGSHLAVVWVSDPYGAPFANRPVEFDEFGPNGPVLIDRANTNETGFARLDVGARDTVFAQVDIGTFGTGTTVSFFPPVLNFTVYSAKADFDRDDVVDEMAVHVVNVTGFPVPALVRVNETSVGSCNANGYLLLDLPRGTSNVTVEYAGENQTFTVFTFETGGGRPFAGGPDLVLSLIATLSALIVSLFAIVLSFDAVIKERVHGTMDLLLSRPASRTGILLGKFLGAFGAVVVPVTLVNLAGIGVISAVSGKGPTGSYAGAFLGLSILLVAYFVLLQLVFSTLAKTSGTAVLFGVLIWLLFNLLYQIVSLVVAGIVFGGDPAGYFRFLQVAGLGNPVEIYRILMGLAAPSGISGVETVLDPGVAGAAAVVWLVLLFALALWTFHKKAAE